MFSLALAVWMIAGVIARVGLDLGSLQAVADARARDADEAAARTAGSVVGAALANGTVVGLILYLAAPLLAGAFGKPEMLQEFRIAALGLPFLTQLWVAAGLVQGAHRVALALWLRDVLHPVLMLGGLLLLARLPVLSGAPLASVMSASALIVGALLLRISAREFSIDWRTAVRFVNPQFLKVLRYSLPLTLVAIVNAGTQWMDRLFVGFYMQAGQLGVYDAGARLARVVAVSLVATGSVFAPMAAALSGRPAGEERRAALERHYRLAARWALLLSLPVAVLLLVRPQLVLALFGAEFRAADTVLRILVIGQLVNVAVGPAGNLLIMTGHQRTEALNTVLTAVLGIALYAYLIPRYGLVGAAVATAVSVSLINVLRVVQGRRRERVLPLSWGMVRAGGAACAAALVVVFVPVPRSLSLVPLVLEQTALTFGAYAAFLLVLRLDPDDRSVFRPMRAAAPGGSATADVAAEVAAEAGPAAGPAAGPDLR